MPHPTVDEIVVDAPPPEAQDDRAPAEGTAEPGKQLVEADLLVEDVSIDGMCGVY
jgi:mycofactocin precursor